MEIVELLERSYEQTATVLAGITPQGYAAPSPCTGWTVRQVGNHLVGGLDRLTRIVEGEDIPKAELDPQRMAEADQLGTDPAAVFRSVAARSTAVFKLPDTLRRTYPFGPGPTPGAVLASLSLLESLVHGWDLARGAGLGYPADPAVVAAVQAFTAQAIGPEQREAGLFGAEYATGPADPPLTALLAYLGRRV